MAEDSAVSVLSKALSTLARNRRIERKLKLSGWLPMIDLDGFTNDLNRHPSLMLGRHASVLTVY